MNPDRRIRRIAIVGGGISGWLAAVTLSRRLGGNCSIHVIEGPDAPPSGEALAILPPVLELLRFLGIDQNDFIEKTQSTYCLGQRFLDWPAPGSSFWHPFGAFGALIERRPFYHFWHKARAAGMNPRPEFFSTEVAMALTGRFIFPTNTLGVATHLRYSLHVDAALAARYLRTLAERAGVIRLERKLVDATRREDGAVEELQFEDGGKLRADLFIDADARAGLITLLGVEFESWQHLLPCDRILTAPQPLGDTRPPYMAVKAGTAGWQWRMPLQRIVSSGLVYSSAHQSDDDAALELAGVAQPLAGTAPALVRLGTAAHVLGEERRRDRARGRKSRAARDHRSAVVEQRVVRICSITSPTRSSTPRTSRRTTRRSARSSSAFATTSSCTTARRAARTLPSGATSRSSRCRMSSRGASKRIARPGASRFAVKKRSPTSTGSGSWMAPGSCRATTIRWSIPSTSSRSNA